MTEKTAQEIANEEMEKAIARGDYLEGQEPEVDTDTEDDQGADDIDSDTEVSGTDDDSDQGSDSVSEDTDDGEADDNMDDDEDDSDSDMGDSVEDDSVEDGIEEDEDLEDEDSEEEGSQPDLKDTRIPKARLDKVIAQREAEKEKTKWLEEQLAKALDNKPTADSEAPAEESEEISVYDFDSAEEAYIEHLLAGETKKAAELRSEINREHAEATRAQMQEITDRAKEEAAKTVSEAKFVTTVESLEAQYPFLDEQHDDYNEEAVDTINSLMSGYIAGGENNEAALLKAVKTMAPIYAPDGSKEPAKTVEKKSSTRTAKAKAKKVKASNQQPATMNKSSKGARSVDTEVSISSLSEKEFSSLTAKERAILRGDII